MIAGSFPTLRRALACHVPSVGLPLAWILVSRVTDPNGHALIEGAGRPATPGCTMCAARSLSPLRHLDEAKHGSQDTRVLTRIFVWAMF
jgi:hypothetical protein